MYLYNLSNSPVLISEGPPSIYLDYPCRPLPPSCLLLLLQTGRVRVRGVLLVSPAPGPPPPGVAPSPKGIPARRQQSSPRESRLFTPSGRVLAFSRGRGGVSACSPLPPHRVPEKDTVTAETPLAPQQDRPSPGLLSSPAHAHVEHESGAVILGRKGLAIYVRHPPLPLGSPTLAPCTPA